MSERGRSTGEKALALNLDRAKYGTIAEIGGGQEVARWLFHVGGAAGTVAKTISAYDMVVSDALYGPTRRYVSRERLSAMLEREFDLLVQTLGPDRGAATNFFAFADTVTTRSFKHQDDGRDRHLLEAPAGRCQELALVIAHRRPPLRLPLVVEIAAAVCEPHHLTPRGCRFARTKVPARQPADRSLPGLIQERRQGRSAVDRGRGIEAPGGRQ